MQDSVNTCDEDEVIPDSIATVLNETLGFPGLNDSFYHIFERRLLTLCGVNPARGQRLSMARQVQAAYLKNQNCLTAKNLLTAFDEACKTFLERQDTAEAKAYWRGVFEREGWRVMVALKGFIPTTPEWAASVGVLALRGAVPVKFLAQVSVLAS